MKHGLIYLLITFFCISCFQKDNSQKVNNVDILLEQANDFKLSDSQRSKLIREIDLVLSKSNNDSLSRDRYVKLAGRYFNIHDYSNYLKTSRKIYEMSLLENDDYNLAKGLTYIADYYYSKFINDSAYFYYTKAEKALDKVNNKVDLIQVRYSKANILLYEKNFSEAEEQIIQVLKDAKEINDQRLIYDCYLTLGNALEGMNYTNEAINYFQKSIEHVKNLKSDPQFKVLNAQAYNYLGKLYSKNGQYSKAIFNFNQALKIANFRKSDPLMYANLINNKAYAQLQLGIFQEAELKLLEALSVREKYENIPGIVSSKLILSEYHLAKKDTLNAIKDLKYAQKTAFSNRIFEDELKAVKALSKIDLKNKGNYFDRYIKLSDSLQNVERANRNKFARIEFETDEILDQKEIIQKENKKISSQLWIILGSSIVSILVLGLAYYVKIQRSKFKQLQFEKRQQENNEEIYRLMLRQQTLIEEVRQNEKKRISQELHDGVMSKLTSTRLNLFIIGKKNDEATIKKCLQYIDDIQNIEKEIRNISHNLNKDSLFEKDSFKVIVENLFQEYCGLTDVKYEIVIDNNITWSQVDSSTKMHLYRIFQESMQNIFKYSNAKNVFLNIQKIDDESFLIRIVDDGLGFDVSKTTKGIGFKNMKSRVKEFKGTLKVDSEIGKGTLIEIIIPFNH